LNTRFLLYVLTFSWSCLVSQYAIGSLGIYYKKSKVGDEYLTWAFPLICNSTFLFAWPVGRVIDKTGFACVSLVLIFLCQLSLLCLYVNSCTPAAWLNLLLLNWIACIQYTIQFVFLHKAAPSSAFPVGLIVVLTVQGAFGFIANPGLSPNPWGQNFTWPLLVLVLPSLPLYAWPAFEYTRRLRLKRQQEEDAAALAPSPPATGAFSSVLSGLVENPHV